MNKQGKILVFDSELDALSKIYIELLLKNFEVEVTANPAEIAVRAKRFKPDVAIINSDAEGFDGSEICTVLKEELNIPIALLISKFSTATPYIDGCRADETITKPVNTDQLHNIVFRLIHSR